MSKIIINKLSTVYLKIDCNSDQSVELGDWFSCYIENRFFHPKVKAKIWDGKISFFDRKRNLLPLGLLDSLIDFCDKYNYQYEFSFNLSFLSNHISEEDVTKFIDSLITIQELKPRDYQYNSVYVAIRNKRGIIQSPTGSGKSLVLYILVRFLLAIDKQILLIVPNIGLVNQMYSDFEDYGWKGISNYVSILYSGKKIDETKPVLISTWQSLYKKDKSFFSRFGGLLIDECLHPLSLIETKKGKIPIKDIKIGDEVLSLNRKTRVLEYKKVIRIYNNLSEIKNNTYEVEFDTGNKIIATGNHKLMTTKNYCRVDKLRKREKILDINNFR